MKAAASLVLAILLNASIASAQTESDWYYPINEVLTLKPDANEKRTVSTGGTLVREYQARSTLGIRLEQDVKLPAATKADATLRAGEILFRIKSKTALKACAIVSHLKSGPECLIDDDGDGVFDRGAKNYVTDAHALTKAISYSSGFFTEIPGYTPNFQRVLLYQGVEGQTLRLSYREFKLDMARPAFTQDMSAPLTSSFPQKVAAKGIVLTLYAIDGLGITYSVDEGTQFAVE